MLEHWKTAHPPPPVAPPTLPPQPPPPQAIRIVSIDLTFDDWITLLVKMSLAAIPAAILMAIFFTVVGFCVRVALTSG